MTTHTLVGGQRLVGVHPDSACAGEFCCIHNPSDHHMVEWGQNWREDRGLMERICPHGIGHPDPDDIQVDTTHGCDGCCSIPEAESQFAAFVKVDLQPFLDRVKAEIAELVALTTRPAGPLPPCRQEIDSRGTE